MSRDKPKRTIAARAWRAFKEELGINIVDFRLRLIQCFVALIPYECGKRLRSALYRLAGIPIGPRTLIYGTLFLTGHDKIGRRLSIGESCRLNTPCRIGLAAPVTIGDNVSFGFGVTIITALHDTNSGERRAGAVTPRSVTIGNGAWLAAHVTVLPGVTIGEGAVIGAGSVVTHDIPPHTLAAGVPARTIRYLPSDETLLTDSALSPLPHACKVR